MSAENIRNIAIIAHVDHGKTTMVDQLLRKSGTLTSHRELEDRAMDSNELERERGITILAKCTSVVYSAKDGKDYAINVVDTPGHADFGGEVERVLKMVDAVVLLVDAFEGPMPQTRFVLRKSLELGLRVIVVINKIDRPDSRPSAVLDLAFDLFVALDADEEQLDFPIVYASAREGFAVHELEDERVDMTPLFETIVKYCPPPKIEKQASDAFCMQVATLGYDNFVGRLAIGRVYDGTLKVGERVLVCRQAGGEDSFRVAKIYGWHGLERIELEEAKAGQIIMLAGLEGILPGDTVNALGHPRRLEPIQVDEPTIAMRFQVNDSPFAGREGKYVTSRQLRDRLFRELETDVSLRVEETETPEAFSVAGRGELHLGVLIERMRREGFELAVSQPRVIMREDEDGNITEPYESVVIECADDYSGTVINKLNQRRGEMVTLEPSGEGMTRFEYTIPSRGLIGFRHEFLTDTRGTGVLHSVFSHFGPSKGEMPGRLNGALVVQDQGTTTAYALFALQERGTMFLGPAEDVYGGQIIGIHNRDVDLVINPNRKKQLTNIRAAGSDDKLILSPPKIMSLEAALEWIEDDELVEVTPSAIRIRKRELEHNRRKRRANA